MSKNERKLYIFNNKISVRFLVYYISFYLIFSPIISTKVLAQSLPINPISGGDMGALSNGVPVLNIAKPSEAGVSVNKFNDFNVGQEGLIINNLNLQNYNFNYKSELSGEHIEFNRNFRDGDAAKVILNEVVSGNATSLLGTTEIYGVKADYIVANPNGITCAGCGFINTSRLSLITGSSNIKNGDIESFTISPNAVLRIDGQGVGNLGLYSPSSADLVSNIIKISGEIQTPEDLRIFQGDESFDWKNFSITSSEKIGSDIAVDVSALGGMKANNIYVVATGKGFGVNLGSDVVANGNIEITSAGDIRVKNAIANDNVIMQTPAKITADNGNIVANNVLIDADNLENKSNIVASDNIYIDTKNEIKNIGKIKGNNLFLSAKDIHNYGQILSNKDMEVMVANNLINYRASGILAGGNIWMKVANDLINYKADIYAGGDLSVEGRDDIENNFVAINPDTVYDNPYVEKEKDLGNVSGGDLSFAMDDDEEEALTFILKNGDEIQLPIDAFPDDATAGAKYEYNGYTFILGTETITEKEIPNPEYEKCENDCESIPQTITKKIYSYSGTDDFTIKDSSGENISYTFGEEDFNDEIDDDIGVLNNTSVVQSNALNEYKNTFLDYDFSNNFLNNFVNLAGRIEAGGNIEINANNIINKSFDINTGANGVSLYYDKIRDKVSGWRTAWKELGRYRISSVNLDGIAGAIVSGKNLILNAENILNQSSILSSKQNMILKSQSLSNITISDVVALPIFMQRVSRKHGKKRRKNRTEYQTQRYYSKQRATILAGGSLSIKSDVLKNDQDVNPTSGIVASVDNPNIVDGKISVEVNLPVGDNGFFKITDNGKYLVETNVPFIDARDYVGSDYFFDGKGALFNGVDTNKIIGDPAYETKIVMDAIVKATGEHYLKNDGSIGSDAEQMKALYDNANDIYEEFGLKVGVALTQEQISALRNDIIWYVEREVGGEKVLVPELYLSQATLDSIDDNRGSKITGFNVGIESDFVSNYGDIKSENLLNVEAKTLLNSGNDENAAKLIAGGGVVITADNVLNLSGTISGGVVKIDADNIINQTKVLSDDYEGPNVKRHTEITGSTSLISGENGVSLNAKNTLVNSGADIESKEGDVRISADTAVFDTVELFNREEKHTSSSSGISSKEKIEINETRKNKSSNINAGGNFILATSGDATFAGANVSVGGDALLDVGGQTNILDVKDTEFNYSKTTKSYAGGLYSTKDIVIDESEKAKGTSVDVVSGLNIISGGDVNIVASDVNVGGDANILAGYSLTDEGVKKTDASSSVNILNDTETTRHYEKHEKSNFVNAVLTLVGGFVVPYNIEIMGVHGFKDFIDNGGKIEVKEKIGEKTSDAEETITKEVVSSNLNISGNLNIGSTDDINIAGSNLITNGNTFLDANNDINIMSSINKINSESEHKDTSVFLTRSAGNSYVDTAFALYSVEEARRQLLEAGDALEEIRKMRDKGLATDEAVKDAEINRDIAKVNLAMKIYEAAESVEKSITSTPFFGFYANVGITEEGSVSKTKTEDTINTSSQILSSGDVIFNADNDMIQKGSDVYSANGDILYNVGNNLNLSASVDTHSSNSSTENYSSSQTIGTNGPGFSVGYGRSSSTEYSEKYNNSTSTAENGDIIYNVGGDMNAIGYNAIAKNILAKIGGNLTLASLQDKEYNVSSSSSADLSVSFSMGDNDSESKNKSNEKNNKESKSDSKNENKSENKPKNNKVETKSDSKDNAPNNDNKDKMHLSGGSGSFKNSDSITDNKSSNISGLIGTESVDIDVGGKLSMSGSVIANISNGVDLGNLNVKASSLEYEDIEDKQYEKETGFGFGLTLGENEKNKKNDSNGTSVGKNTGIRTNNSGDSIYLAMTDKGFEGNDHIHSTIGNGNLEITDGSGEGINRDIGNIVEEGDKKVTGALDFEVTIDLDLFYDVYDILFSSEGDKSVEGKEKEDDKSIEEKAKEKLEELEEELNNPDTSDEEKEKIKEAINKLTSLVIAIETGTIDCSSKKECVPSYNNIYNYAVDANGNMFEPPVMCKSDGTCARLTPLGPDESREWKKPEELDLNIKVDENGKAITVKGVAYLSKNGKFDVLSIGSFHWATQDGKKGGGLGDLLDVAKTGYKEFYDDYVSIMGTDDNGKPNINNSDIVNDPKKVAQLEQLSKKYAEDEDFKNFEKEFAYNMYYETPVSKLPKEVQNRINNLPDEGKQIIMSTYVQYGQNSGAVGEAFEKFDNDYEALKNIVGAKSEKYPARHKAELNALNKMVNNK